LNPATTQSNDTLSENSTSIFTILGFLGVVGVWQIFSPLAPSTMSEQDAPKTTINALPPKSSGAEQTNFPTDHKVIQDMADYLSHNPSAAFALSTLSQSKNMSPFSDIDLYSTTEFLPQNREKLAHRMNQIAAERPAALANEFRETFSVLFANHAEVRTRLLQLARYVGDSPAGDSVKEIILQQASTFLPSQNPGDATFGKDSLQTYLEMEKDPVKRKLGASRITSQFVEINSP
jgi:hypothetical protein